jgi:type I restriction enzyme M protein
MNSTTTQAQSLASFVWSIAEILRGDFKQADYGKVVLPFIVMRRLDCILEASKTAVLEAAKGLPEGLDDATRDMILFGAIGGNIRVYNLSCFTFKTAFAKTPGQLHQNLIDYITKFSPNVRRHLSTSSPVTDQLKRLKEVDSLGRCFD